MSSRPRLPRPAPAAESFAARFAVRFGAIAADERSRRRWTTRGVAARARVSASTISNVEAGRRASLDVYARLAVALGLDLEVIAAPRHARRDRGQADLVHSAMGELEISWLGDHGYQLAIDHPYQHYQFAGRADVLAWTLHPPALLHIENRTRLDDLQAVAGSYNAKRRYLARTLAQEAGIDRFASETHVIAGLWSAEVIHRLRIRRRSFEALCSDGDERVAAWLRGAPPERGRSSSLIVVDPFASGRQRSWVGLERVLEGIRPRLRDYRDAAERLRLGRRA